MSAPAIAVACLAGLFLLGTGGAGGYVLRDRLSANLCGCGHAWTCVDKFTGHCTATVIETNFVAGVRRTRKRVPCSCRQHRPPQPAVAAASLDELLEATS